MMDLNPQEIDKAKFVFSIYDFEGKDRIDAFNLGDALRALDLTPSLKTIGKLGGAKNTGEKFYSIEEFLSIYSEAKKDKDCGCLADYIELLKCWDKHNDGLMPISELNRILLGRGERFNPEVAGMIMHECCEKPDEDGNIKYKSFLSKICEGPYSPFDDVDIGAAPTSNNAVGASSSSNSNTLSAPPGRKLRPSITIDDEDIPSVSFAAAKPMSRKGSAADNNALVAEQAPETSFSFKAPRKSITPTDG